MNLNLHETKRFRIAESNWRPKGFFFSELREGETRASQDLAHKEACESYPMPTSLLDVPPFAAIVPDDDFLVPLTTREEAIREAARLNRASIESAGLRLCIEWHCVVEIVSPISSSTGLMPQGTDPANLTYEEWRAVHYSVRVVKPTEAERKRFGDTEFVTSKIEEVVA